MSEVPIPATLWLLGSGLLGLIGLFGLAGGGKKREVVEMRQPYNANDRSEIYTNTGNTETYRR